MSYSVVDPVSVDASRQCKDAKIIPGCMMGHMLVYTPHSSNVTMEEFLCDCESCLSFNFEECTRKEEVVQIHNNVENGDCSWL